MDWEQRTAIKRSEGTFFQNLYRIKKEHPGTKEAAAVQSEVLTYFAVSRTPHTSYLVTCLQES